jgi:hypothetical protein
MKIQGLPAVLVAAVLFLLVGVVLHERRVITP